MLWRGQATLVLAEESSCAALSGPTPPTLELCYRLRPTAENCQMESVAWPWPVWRRSLKPVSPSLLPYPDNLIVLLPWEVRKDDFW
jgi:hypothetical protein